MNTALVADAMLVGLKFLRLADVSDDSPKPSGFGDPAGDRGDAAQDSGPQPGHQPGHVLDREDFRRLDAAGNQRYIDGVAQVYDTYGADWTQLCAEVPGLEGMCQSWPLLMEKRLQGRTLLGAGCAERSEVH